MRNILIAMALVLAALPLRAQQWARTTGPEGAEIVSIASTDIMVLAITRPGVLHSFNGAEWRNLGPTDARQLYAVGNTYIALSSEGLSRSTDRGLHWQRTSITGSFLKVAIDDGMLYAADDSTIYRSGDQGLTWSVLAHPGMSFYSFHVSGSVILLGRGEEEGLFRSGDSGRSWSHIEAGVPAGIGPNAFQRIGSAVYAAFSGFGVYRSLDAGVSWSPMNEGFTTRSGHYPMISSFLAVGDRLWAAEREAIYLNDGARWIMKSRAMGNVLAKGDGFIYHGSDVGVSSTTDSGASWFSINRGLTAHRVGALAWFDGAVYANGGGAIHMSTDNGMTWERSGLIAADRFAVGHEAIYALGSSTSIPGIFRATRESPWQRISDSLPYPTAYLTTLSASGDTLFTGYRRAGWDSVAYWRYGGVYRSTDRGATWSAANNGLPNDGHAAVLIVDIIQVEGVVLAMTADGLYRSTDNGDHWRRLDGAIPGDNNYGIFAAGGGGIYLAGSNFVMVSSDEGLTWSSTGGGLPQGGLIHHLQFVKGRMYATVTDGANIGRLFRHDGDRWIELTDRLPAGIGFETFMEAGDAVLGGTQWSSVWRGSLDAPSGVDERGERGDLALSPNPFTTSSSVGFTLDRGGDVRVWLVSSSGEDAGTIFRGMLDAGAHSFRVDGTGLASGVYRVLLAAGGRVMSVGGVKLR